MKLSDIFSMAAIMGSVPVSTGKSKDTFLKSRLPKKAAQKRKKRMATQKHSRNINHKL